MNSRLTVSDKELQRSLQLYAAATRKDEADILNRAGKNIAFRAAQFTPRASASAILAELSKNANELAIKILSKRGRFKGVPIKERQEIVKKFISARRKSAGYIRAGWGPAIVAFGGNPTRLKLRPNSKFIIGFGKRATHRHLMAVLANNARGAEKVARGPLRKAIAFVARDMASYARRKLGRTASKASSK